MRLCGIIAEYDPLHNGHAWQLSEARRLSQAEHMLCVMSGAFTQRGMPALLSAHVRAQMALEAGADVVLGLPTSFSVCEAERFALGGVALLRAAGADALSFGIEPEGMPLFERAAALLEQPTPTFEARLHALLSQGVSFPQAQGQALAEQIQAAPDALALPNTVLAICYARANLRLKAGLELIPIPRRGAYHDTKLPTEGALPSASAVRAAIAAKDWVAAAQAMPPSAYRLLRQSPCHPADALDALLRWKIRTTADFSALPGLSEGLQNRLPRACDCLNRADMVQSVKSKRYPYARVNRLLTHVLLGTQASMLSPLPQYAYLLGFRKTAAPVLHQIKARGLQLYSAVPPNAPLPEMRLDITADELWALGAKQPFGNCFREKPVVL